MTLWLSILLILLHYRIHEVKYPEKDGQNMTGRLSLTNIMVGQTETGKTIMGSMAVSVWSIAMQLTYLSENIFFPRCRRKDGHTHTYSKQVTADTFSFY